MKRHFSIKPHVVHLWQLFLPDFLHSLDELLTFLNPDEVQRVNRFRFLKDKQRFIISHAYLRKTLALYTQMAPQNIAFAYGPHQKPYLKNLSHLQFNMSHSHQMALFAITHTHEIGVDIEKKAPPFKEAVAKRFFSAEEYTSLMQLPSSMRLHAFYQIWAGKEAVIKATGLGLYLSLKTFSLPLNQPSDDIHIRHKNHTYLLHAKNIIIHPEYASAFALSSPIKKIEHWQWQPNGFKPAPKL